MNSLEITTWETPCTENYPLTERGEASLEITYYEPGMYHMEGIKGYDYYWTDFDLPVICLKIDNEVWMVDDPLHWYAMGSYMEAAKPGHLLCAGLGLGLMLWHAVRMDKFLQITVVEQNEDVAELVWPLIPNDKRFNLIIGDYYNYAPAVAPDCILWDLAVGDMHDAQVKASIDRGIIITELMFPGVPGMVFGVRHKQHGFYIIGDG